jgi:hypothetical protein
MRHSNRVLGKPAYRRGSEHHGAILTEVDVVEIRKQRPRGDEARRMAKNLGITAGTIQDVLSGRCWRHVTI